MSNEAVNIYNQGYRYYTGTDGYPLNHKKALDCFQKAAESGLAAAMNYLGLFYERGELVLQNYRIAVDWFYRAIQADPKCAHAAYNLGRMYHNGTGVEKDMAKAFQLFECSVNLGLGNTHSAYPKSCYLAGCIMLSHYHNPQEAFPYFIDAAKYGNIPEAWHNLGYLAENGHLPSRDPSNPKGKRDGTAREFYEEAAKLGYAPSMDALGRLYASYNMITEARMWTEKAVAKGYEPAKKRLKMLNVAQSGSIFDFFR